MAKNSAKYYLKKLVLKKLMCIKKVNNSAKSISGLERQITVLT